MKFEIIEDKEQLYDKCENIEELYDNFYYQLLVENQELKEKQNYDLNWAFKYDELHKENVELKKQLEDANEQISYHRRSIERKEERIHKTIFKQNYKSM